MKIKINTDQGEKEIDCMNPKGFQTKKGLKLLLNLEKNIEKDDNAEVVTDYMEYVEEIAIDRSSLNKDEFDNLEDEEQQKIIKFYQDRIYKRLDFLKPSQKQEA